MPRIVHYHGTPHTFPDDFTDSDVQQALTDYDAQRVAAIKQRLPELQQQAQQAATGWERQTIPQQLIQGSVRALPTIGGTIGALLGGTAGAIAGTPADIAVGPIGTAVGAFTGGARGAAMGGGTGRALEQIIAPYVGLPEEAGQNPLDVAGRIAQSTVGQTVLAKGPEVAGLAARPAAQKLMSTALGSWGNRVARAANTALQQRIGPGFRWGRPVAQLDKLMSEGNSLSNRLIKTADQQGARIDPTQMDRGPAMRKLLSKSSLTDKERGKIGEWNDEFLSGKAVDQGGRPLQNPIPQPIANVDEMRGRYADEAAGNFAAAAEKEYQGPIKDLRKLWAQAMATDLRSLTHSAMQQAGFPEFTAVERHLSDLINLKNTLKPVAKKQALSSLATRGGAAALGAAGGYGAAALGHQDYPHRLAAAGLGAALLSPPGLSNMALGGYGLLPFAPYIAALLQGSRMVNQVTGPGTDTQGQGRPTP